VTQIDYIKHLRDIEGASISEIAIRVKCDWKTAKKYADGNIDLRQRGRRSRKKTVMKGFEEYLEAWLHEDQRMPKKQRRTAKKIFEELQKLGYQGSDRTVREYVRKIKQEMRSSAQEQAIRLEQIPGEAQVDFGAFKAITGKERRTYYELVLSFPHSNAQVCMVLPSENGVCLLHGLQELFCLIGGVPRVIRFDNLSPVVAKILSGEERTLTEMFKTFQWHYRFQAEFCNPGRGQEKGHVENKVGYVRRNNFSPLPIIDDLDEFNRNLNRAMIADREREHYAKGALISELWEDDLKNLLPLPEMPMDIFQLFTRTVNKYGEVRVDDQLYRVPNVAPGRRVLIKACWDQLEILDKHGETVLHMVKRVYFQKAEDIDWAAELEIFINRPRAAERAVYLRALPDTLKTYILSAPDLKERRQRIIAAIAVLRQYPLGVAVKAAKQALDYGQTDINSLRMFAALQAGASTPTPGPIEEPWTPSEVTQWQPDLSIYDLLGVTGHAK
jgi:transposase